MNDRYAPPAIAATLVLVPPELSPPLEPPLEVEGSNEDVPVPDAGVFAMPVNGLVLGGELGVVLEMVTIGGAVGVASGSLPAALASTGSNAAPLYTQSIRHMRDRPAEHAYCIIQERPTWDRGIVRNVKGVPECDDKPPN